MGLEHQGGLCITSAQLSFQAAALECSTVYCRGVRLVSHWAVCWMPASADPVLCFSQSCWASRVLPVSVCSDSRSSDSPASLCSQQGRHECTCFTDGNTEA